MDETSKTTETEQEATFQGSGGGNFEEPAGTVGESEPAGNSGESDGRGSGDVGSAADGDGTADNGQDGNTAVSNGTESGNSEGSSPQGNSGQPESGQLQTSEMGNSETSVSGDGQEVFEGVTASEFDDAMQQLNDEISLLNATGIVLVAALFACFGALCVQTLIRSFTWEK